MTASPAQLLHHLRRTTAPASEVAADADLLTRFRLDRDEAAFAALVARHGPMVLRVCQHVLGNLHAAEDAFQASFLALARRPESVRRPESLASWLHGVALRTALKARGRECRRRFGDMSEALATPDPRPDPLTELSAREVLAILHEEVTRLPQAYRLPVLLCCLEGLSQEEAGRRLGWTASSVKGRLARGRKRLHARLLQRGLTLPAALAAVEVSRASTRASVSAGLVATVTQGATLAQAVLRKTTSTRLALLAVLTLGLAAVGAGVLTRLGTAVPPTEEKEASPPASAPQPKKETRAGVDRFGDPLPRGALARFGTVRFRHGGGFNDAALSPDGKTLVATSEIGITFFDVQTGVPRPCLRAFEIPNGFSSNRSLLDFAPDGKTFVSLAQDGTARLWDTATGKEVRRLGTPRATAFWGLQPRGAPPTEDFLTRGVHFADGGKAVLLDSHTGSVRFHDVATGKLLRQFSVGGLLAGIAADHKTLFSFVGKEHVAVALYDAATGKLRRRFEGEKKLQVAALAPDGKTLVAASAASRLFFWDVESGKLRRTIQVPLPRNAVRDFVTVLAVTPDSRAVLAGTQEGDILRWDLATGKELPPLRGNTRRLVSGLFFPPGGKALVSMGWDGVLRRWNLATGKQQPSGEGYERHVQMAMSPGGRAVVIGDEGGRLDLWASPSGKLLRCLVASGPSVTGLAFAPDGGTLAVGLRDNRVILWNAASWHEKRTLRLPGKLNPMYGAWFEGLTFSPDGRRLFTACEGDGTRLWDLSSGKELWHQPGHGRGAFAPDGKTLVSGGWGRPLSFLDPATGKLRFAVAAAGRDIIDDIAFSPDGRLLATCHHDATIRLRDPKDGRELKCLKAHKEVVWEISFSPDGKWLLSTGCDHSVRLHEVVTGQEVLRLDGHEGRVYHGRFGPDGKTALTASWDLTALLWSLRPTDLSATASLESLWQALRSEKAATAYRAAWALLDDPAAAVRLLRGKLMPARAKMPRETTLKRIADLDSDSFRRRRAAEMALAEQGKAVGPLLREALTGAKSLEQRRRIKALLERLRREPSLDEWRIMRAVQVAELCATPEARRLLRNWAGGAAGALLTEQAKAALARLR